MASMTMRLFCSSCMTLTTNFSFSSSDMPRSGCPMARASMPSTTSPLLVSPPSGVDGATRACARDAAVGGVDDEDWLVKDKDEEEE
jgi:hypothetical protein